MTNGIAVSKSAAIHLAACLAKSLAPTVRCNSIAPGLVATDWIASFTQEYKEMVIGMSALQKFTQPEDVAEAARKSQLISMVETNLSSK